MSKSDFALSQQSTSQTGLSPKQSPPLAACSVHLTLQQFADSALQRERLEIESRDKSHSQAKLPVWQSLAKSLSSSFRKPDLAKNLAAESDNRDAPAESAFPAPSTPLGRSLQGSVAQLDSNQAQSSDKLEDEFKGRDAGASDSGLQEQSLHGDESEHNQEASVSAERPAHSRGKHRSAGLKPGPGQIHHDAAQMLWHKTLARVSCATSEHAADGGATPQEALPETEVDKYLADEENNEAVEGTAPQAAI